VNRIGESIAGFWRNSRDWSLGWQLVIATLVILVGALVAASISDALHGQGSDNPSARNRKPTKAVTRTTSTSGTSSSNVGIPPTKNATTTVVTRPSPTTAPPARLIALTISAQTHANTYDRDQDFGGWVDVDGCKNARAVLLIRTSSVPVTFTRQSACTVKTGRWTDPWSGVTTTVAHDFQIDHTVPLANAWRSGAWSWTHQRRVAFANNLTDRLHLVPILASENGSKSDRGPDEWKPPNQSTWCRYALVWDRIKAKWHLSATRAEWDALVAMEATC
jgi:hypothetical protein